MTTKDLMQLALSLKASDLHLVVGGQPVVRIHGELKALPNTTVLDQATVQTLVTEILRPEQKAKLESTRELDFSLAVAGLGRWRANAYYQRGGMSLALRSIGDKIPTIEELRLPKICHNFATLKQGFILVTGPSGQGKSSTLAAIIQEINMTRAEHIVTIEDPIEFVYTNQKSIISQRELGSDTMSWTAALKSVFREDPNVVLVGEMRDPETMAAAITIAETGHLVFATLHTNSAAQTIDRIIDSFPNEQQAQIRIQLSTSLEAVLTQRLVPAKVGGRIPAVEVMIATPAVRNTIREAKTHQLDSIIQTSSELGMITLESSLAGWVNDGTIDFETARQHALRPADLTRLVR